MVLRVHISKLWCNIMFGSNFQGLNSLNASETMYQVHQSVEKLLFTVILNELNEVANVKSARKFHTFTKKRQNGLSMELSFGQRLI